MKKLIIASILSMFSLNSFANFSLSCPEIYQKIIVHQEIKQNRLGDVSSNLSALSLMSLIAVPELGLALMGASLASGAYGNIPTKEQRAMSLTQEGSRQIKRFTKKLQKNIDVGITEDEVIGIIDEGLNSGLYCSNFPDLYSRREIKKHVRTVLIGRYSVRQ